jgi:DNA processing protein
MSAAPLRYLVALSALPSLGPQRLNSILDAHPADEAFQMLAAGRRLSPDAEPPAAVRLFDTLRLQAATLSVDAVWEACLLHRVTPLERDHPQYPAALAGDQAAPAVIFVRGAPDTLLTRRVAIVGTRNATAGGRATAFELGHGLAEHGVAVVSGLARGIDGAAHRGVRAASGRAVGVVANGLDVAYPRQNADIWDWVAEHGLLISERPPGCPPEAWRFPLRNRIIAALCELLVVVESRDRGGSLITVAEAAARGIDVMAVPGSPRTKASHGTNRLLVDGATPVTCLDDVLVALGLDHRRDLSCAGSARTAAGNTADAVADAVDLAVIAACSDGASTLDMLAMAIGCTVAEVALSVMRLEREGLLLDAGGWFESSRSKLTSGRSRGSEAGGP